MNCRNGRGSSRNLCIRRTSFRPSASGKALSQDDQAAHCRNYLVLGTLFTVKGRLSPTFPLEPAPGTRESRHESLRSLAVDHVRTFLERRRKPRKRRVEHRAHQGREHAALELIGDEEADVAGLLTLRLEGPAVLQAGERSPQVAHENLEI